MAHIVRVVGSGQPECQAATAALQHLSAMEKQLKNEETEYDEEAMQHLAETAEAIKELEHVRRATRELLEEETIETSKLRFKILHLPGNITKEITDAVLMARESNASQLNQLQNELKNIIDEIENTNQKQLSLEALNSSLCDHGKKMWDRHEKVVDLLNLHMANKAGENIALNETYSKTKDIKQAVIDLKHSVVNLEEDMAVERERYAKDREQLNKEITEMELKIESRKNRNLEKQECLEKVHAKVFEKEENIDNVKEVISNVNYQISQLKNSNTFLTKQLDQRTSTTVELSNKKSYLESQLTSMKEACINERERLNNKIAKVEETMQKTKYLNEMLMSKNTILNEQFLSAQEEEDRECRRKQDATQQFQKAAIAFEEQLEHLAKLKMEIKGMEEEIGKIKESSQLITDVYGTQLEESRESLQQERQKRMALQMKKDEITKQAELWRHSEDKYIHDMNERLEAAKIKFAELSEEGRNLQRDITQSDSQIKLLTEEQIKAEEENKNLEQGYLADIENLEDKSKMLKENLQNKVEELQVKLPFLQDVKNKFEEENIKYEDIKQQVGDLKHKKKVLEDSINVKKKDIEVLSNAKEKQRKELKGIREAVLEQLKKHTEETKMVERNVYETNRKLELVIMENCRLKLSNTQKKHDIRKVLQEAENQKTAAINMNSDLLLLRDLLLKGFAQDSSTRKDFTEHDQEILEAMMELVKKIQQREEKLGNLTNRLQDKFTGIASLLQRYSSVEAGTPEKNL